LTFVRWRNGVEEVRKKPGNQRHDSNQFRRLALVCANATLLKQILNNLINNALNTGR